VTLLLLILLVALWGAVIIPALLNHHSSRSSTDRFRRSLQALGNRSVRSSRPRRRSSIEAGRWIMGPPPARSRNRRPAPARRPAAAREAGAGYGRYASARVGSASAGRSPGRGAPGRPPASALAAQRRAEPRRAGVPRRSDVDWEGLGRWDPVIERRRHVFIGLLAAAAGTLVLGLLPSLGFLLKLNIVVDLALAGYVVFLVRSRPRDFDRDFSLGDEVESGEEHWLRAGEL
jgi:hypothetical protein